MCFNPSKAFVFNALRLKLKAFKTTLKPVNALDIRILIVYLAGIKSMKKLILNIKTKTMIKRTLSFVLAAAFAVNVSFGQEASKNCHTMENLARLEQMDPNVNERMQQIEQMTEEYVNNGGGSARAGVITIPVVVHVLYNTTAQNISTAQIQSQINILNADFRLLNADKTKIPSAFTSLAADAQIEFCLATVDPNGATTTGITRTQTSVTSFSTDDRMKYTSQGGKDAWNSSKYLNLWVCNIGGGILGYAQFPGSGAAATDGVVIGYQYFGNTGTAVAPFNKGRTATHEVGHWLNLRHIWGDASCGSDLVSDTPTQQTSNYGCPSFPHKTCSNTTNGDMFMNYMDYTDDACMYMFSAGQKARMQALFTTGGARVGLLTSTGCSGTSTTPTTCGVPSSLVATSITTSSANLTWAAVSGATSYSIQYKKVSATTWTTTTSTSASKLISGLTAATQYEFKVSTVCASGSSAYATAVKFTTATTTTSTSSTLTVGTGTGTTSVAPYGSYYMDERVQFIITASELAAAGYNSTNNSLKSIAFYVSGTASTQTLTNFTVKIGTVTATNFASTSFYTTTSLTNSYVGNYTATSNAWNTHTLTTPFTYNGTSNLFVEICWNNSTYSSNSSVSYTATSEYRTLYYRADNASAGVCTNATGTRTYNRPNMRFEFGVAGGTSREQNTMLEELFETPSSNEIEMSEIGKIYPNPSNGNFNIEFAATKETNTASVRIYNVVGHLVAEQKHDNLETGVHKLEFNLNSNGNELSPGMYLCTMEVNGESQTHKFIVNK